MRLEAPAPTPAVRRLRLRRVLFGLFRLIGTLALIPLGAMGLLALTGLLLGSAEADALPWVAALPVALLLGRFLRGRHRPRILYLRAFSHPGVDDVVTLSATGAVGRHYRLITLDDMKLHAIGVPRGAKIRAWITALVFPPLIGLLLYSLWGGVSRAVEGAISAGFQSAADSAEPGIVGAITAVFGGFLAALAMGLMVGAFVLGFFALAASLGTWIGLGRVLSVVSIAVAERWKRSRVGSQEDLQRLTRRLARWKRKRWAPRLHVVSVGDGCWKEAVEEVAGESQSILMDLSYPSEGLYWEAERFLTRDSHPCVLVADQEEFEGWHGAVNADDLVQRFRRLLEDRTVIPFHRDDPGGGKGFQKALRTAFDAGFLGGA